PPPSLVGGDDQEVDGDIDMSPSRVAVEDFELEFIKQLARLIPSPRAAKRFTNIYRFIRASLSPEETEAFLAGGGAKAEFRVVLVLLAVLTGFPEQADLLFGSLAGELGDARVGDFYPRLAKKHAQAQGWPLFVDALDSVMH